MEDEILKLKVIRNSYFIKISSSFLILSVIYTSINDNNNIYFKHGIYTFFIFNTFLNIKRFNKVNNKIKTLKDR